MMKKLLLTIVGLLCFASGYSQVLINEDFSTATGTTPPTGWTNNDLNSSGEVWRFNNPGSRTLNSPISSPAAIFDSDNYGSSGGAEDAALESPAFDASSGTIVLTFDHYFYGGAGGGYAVEVYDGTDWDTIIDGTSSTSNPTSESLDITTLTGGSTAAKVRFHWTGDYSWYWIIDNVTISSVSCLAPSALGVTNFTPTSADVYWTSGGAANWDVEYDTTGFAPGSGTLVHATDDTLTIGSLSAFGVYDFYVRDSCGTGNSSSWVGPFTFSPNSSCAGAAVISTNGTYSSGGPSSGDGCENCSSASHSNWYQWTAPSNGLLDISACGLSGTDTRLWVYDGTCGTLNQVGADDDACTSSDGFASEITGLQVFSGTTYYLEWDNRWSSSPFQFTVTFTAVSCSAPSALGVDNIGATTADLYWTSGGAANWDVEYGLDGFTPGSGTLVHATNDTLSVTGLSSATAYEFYVRDSCGVGNSSSWAGPFRFLTGFIPPTPLNCTASTPVTIFTEEFAAVGGWTGDVNGGNDTWEIPGAPTSSNTGPDNEHSGPSGSFMNFEASNTSVSSGQIVSPPIDLTNAVGDAELSFWMHAYGADMGTLTVGVGTSATGPFTSVFTWSGEYQTSGSDPWVNIGADLSSYIGQVIYIQFHQLDDGSSYEGDMSIDLVEVSACISCPDPSALAAANPTTTGVDLSWTTGGAANWQIEYGAPGFTLGTGTLLGVSTNPYTVSGLSPNTAYEAYVRDSCGVGDVSGWIGPVSFVTACASGLSGTYTIDHSLPTSGTNYNSFAEAAADLNNCGISAAVTFNVQSGLYVDQLHLNGVSGTSVINTITFNGTGGDTLTWSGTGEQGTVIIDNTSHVILQNMLITNPASSEAWGVLLTNNSDTITIDNCVIEMDSISTSTDICGVLVSGSYDNDLTEGGDVDGLTVSNSHIIGGYYAMNFEGVGTGSPSLNYTITDNVLSSFNIAGLYLDEIENITITGNTIESSRGTCDGLYMFDLNNFEIEENIINVTDYALYISDGNDGFTTTTNSRIVNNMITSTGDYGIYLNDFESTDVFHNSVIGEPAIRINDQIGLDVRNNIFVSTGDFAFESTDALATGDVVDYNVYYSNGTNAFDIGTSSYADLAAWQTGDATRNINSVEGDPLFVSATDLHVFGTIANDAGDATVGVLTDIDGELRSATTPDIGADEYTPPSCAAPTGLGVDSVNGSQASVAWTSSSSTTSSYVEYGPTGFTPGTGTVISTLTDSVYITGLSPVTTYDVCVWDSCNTDQSPRVCVTFTTTCGVFMAPHTESFNTTSLPACWSTYSSGSETFDFGTNTYGPGSDNTGGGSYYANVDDSESPSTSDVTLESPLFDVSGLTNPSLQFYLASADATVTVSVDVWDGTMWNVGVFTHAAATATTWELMTVNLTPYAAGDTIAVRFVVDENNGTYQNDIGIDDVQIISGPSCPAPSALGSNPASGTTANIFWATGGASNWNVEYGPTGFTPGSGTTINAANDTVTITGLAPNLPYEFYVRDSCAIGDVSSWVGPFTFFGTVTPCDNFDGYSTGLIDNQSALINGWAGSSGDAAVSTDYANSGSNSLKIYDSGTNSFSDVVAEVGVYSTGIWNVSMDVYVPQSFGGYYNILHNYQGTGTNVWAIEVNLDSNGVATVEEGSNGSNTIGTYSYNVGAWNTIEHVIDLDNDTAYIKVNGVATIGWQFSLGSTNFGGQFNAVNFYSSAPTGHTPLIYFDNFCITPFVCSGSPVALGADSTSATTADLYWTGGGASNWNVEYGPLGFTPGTGTMVNAANDTLALTGLTSNLVYEYYVRDSCSLGSVGSWSGPFTFGSSITPCDDFDGYATGLADPQSWLIEGWAGAGGDAEISTTYASSGTQSLKIHTSGTNAFSDVVADVGVYNSGVWNMKVDVYVPSTYGGYYNILHNYQGTGTNVWAIEVTLDANGTATVDEGSNGTATIGTFSYNTGAWNTFEHIIDLNNDTAFIIVNGVATIGWQFSLGSANFGDQFNAMNFYSTAPTGQTPLIYFDNFCVTPHTIVPCLNTAGADSSLTVCASNTTVDLSNFLLGADPGGSWVDMGATGALAGTMFDASAVAAGGVYNFSYVVGATGCQNDTATITVNVANPIDAGAGLTDTVCDSLNAVDLTAFLDANAATGGSWIDVSGSGALSGSDFDASAVANWSSYTFRYMVSDSCGADSADITLYVKDCDISIDEYTTGVIGVYPNPSTGIFHVENLGTGSQTLGVEVYSVNGKLLMSRNFNGRDKASIDLGHFAAGIYHLKVVTDDAVEIHRVLKK